MLLSQVVCPVLVNRERELEALLALLADAAAGRGHLVLLVGDAGVGKTRLLRELRRHAVEGVEAASGAAPGAPRGPVTVRVIEGRSTSDEAGVPFGPFMDALRFRLARGEGTQAARALGPLVGHLAPLFPELGAPASGDAVAAAAGARPFDLVLEVLRRLAEDGPLVLVLEDFHWADPTSRELLRHLGRRVGELPLLLVATARADAMPTGHPTRRLFAELTRERVAREIALAPLGTADVARMIAASLGRTPGEAFADAVWRCTEGNPYFVEEVLTALADAGRLAPGAPLDALPDVPLPASVRDAVVARVEPLGERASEALNVGAVIGRRFDFALLRDASGIPEEELLAALERLVAHGLLVEVRAGASGVSDASGEGREAYAFTHGLARDVLYERALAPRRRLWHRRVAEALESRLARAATGATGGVSTDALAHEALAHEALAHHFARGGDPARARAYAARAGDLAARLHAWSDAEGLYERALATAEGAVPDPAGDAELLEKLAVVAWRQGSADRALDHAEAALVRRRALGDRHRQAELLRVTGLLHAYYRNEGRRALAHLREALTLLADDPMGALAARVLNDTGRLLAAGGAIVQAEGWVARGLEAARHSGDRAEEAFALAKLGYLTVLRGAVGAGTAQLEQARALMERGVAGAFPVDLDRATGVYNAGIRAFEAARERARATEWVHAASAYSARHGVPANDAVYQAWRASAERHAGHWDEALCRAREAADTLRAARRVELREALRVLGDLHRVRGELAAAESAYAEALALGERDAEIGRALGRLSAGRAAEAAEALTRLLERRDPEDRLLVLRVLPALVEAHLAAGRPGDAEDALDWLAVDAVRADFPPGHAALDFATGLVKRARGDGTGAAIAFACAGDAYDALLLPYESARAQLELAAVLLDGGRDAERGLAAARGALAAFDALGALPEVDAARRVLRRAGVRTRPRSDGPREAPAAGAGDDAGEVAALTGREREVLSELATGRTNKEIARALGIAERTVGVHVGHILAKLKCATRTQAATMAMAGGLVMGGER